MVAKFLLNREPVLFATAIVAVLNLILGRDSGVDVQTVGVVVTVLMGLVARQKVTPVGSQNDSGAEG